MKAAILETGKPPPQLIDQFGRYPDMFRRLLGGQPIGRSYDVAANEFPERPEAHSAYIVTGSPAGVYEDLPWIEPLKQFLRETKGKAKLIGVCFGHQIMAEAFGGKVVKSEKGWGVGLHRYELLGRTEWMDDAEEIAVPASHQDQVVVQPPRSTLLASNRFCPIAMLSYDDQPAISLQFHPEFEPEYAAALIESRQERLPDPEGAIASLQAPNDRMRVGRWISSFLES